MKNLLFITGMFFVSAFSLIAQTNTLTTWDATHMPWMNEYWYNLPVDPLDPPLSQDHSGEDWPYRLVKDGTGTSAKYVLVGYARHDGPIGQNCNSNGTVHKLGGTIVQLDNSGAMVWQKLYREKINIPTPLSGPTPPFALHTELHGLVKVTESGTDYYIATGFTSRLDGLSFNSTVSNPSASALISGLTPTDYAAIMCDDPLDWPTDDPATVFYNEHTGYNSWINGADKRVIYVVKVNASSGNVVWEKLYNTANASDYYTNPCDNYRAIGWDVELLSNGNYLIVGCAPNMAVTQNDTWRNVGKYTHTMQMFMMEMNPNGERLWIQSYDPSASFSGGSNRASAAYAIARKPGTDDFAISGRFFTDKGWVGLPEIPSSRTTRSRCFAGKFTYAGGGSAPSVTFQTLDNSFHSSIDNSKMQLTTEVDFSTGSPAKILVPVISNCTECYEGWTGKAEGKVVALDPSTLGLSYITNALPEIEAFDLKMGITPTSDGGCAVLSSKIVFRDEKLMKRYGGLTAKAGSDATAAKLNSSGTVTNCITFDALNKDGECPDDWKDQECMYSIVENVEGSNTYYVLCGNNSSNADDHYVVKTKIGCPSTSGIYDLSTVPSETSAAHDAWNKIINSTSYTGHATGLIDTHAGQTVHLTHGFKSKPTSGSVHLYIDTFQCDNCN